MKALVVSGRRWCCQHAACSVSCISVQATHSKTQTAKSVIVRHHACGLKILKTSQFVLHPALKAFL